MGLKEDVRDRTKWNNDIRNDSATPDYVLKSPGRRSLCARVFCAYALRQARAADDKRVLPARDRCLLTLLSMSSCATVVAIMIECGSKLTSPTVATVRSIQQKEV